MVAPRSSPRRRLGFSLVEVVVVVVILGTIAAIAIPRMSSAAGNSIVASVKASTNQVQRAIELYAAEHVDRSPAHNADGSVSTDAAQFVSRLLGTTDDYGAVSSAGLYGPYLRAWPMNMANRKSTVRIGGAAPGANTHGWCFDPGSRTISPDHAAAGGTPVDIEASIEPLGGGDSF